MTGPSYIVGSFKLPSFQQIWEAMQIIQTDLWYANRNGDINPELDQLFGDKSHCNFTTAAFVPQLWSCNVYPRDDPGLWNGDREVNVCNSVTASPEVNAVSFWTTLKRQETGKAHILTQKLIFATINEWILAITVYIYDRFSLYVYS